MNRRELLKAGLATTLALGPFAIARAGEATPDTIEAELLDGGMSTISGAELKDLRNALRGRLLLPTGADYNDARRLVGRFNRRPAFIVQPTRTADVQRAVEFARAKRLLMSVKGGGHSDWGISGRDKAMMLDLSRLQGVRVDERARRAVVEGATLCGAIDSATVAKGLAVPLAGMPTVGIGGLATGGGIGKLSRRFGLTLDSIRSIEIVTADGRAIHASAQDEPDVFWAVRGGGSNFGVVTSFKLDLHPIPTSVIGGSLRFPFEQARQVLTGYGALCAAAPDELYIDCFLGIRATPAESSLQIGVCHTGDPDKSDALLGQLRKLGTVLHEDVAGVDYRIVQRANVRQTARTASADRPPIFFRSGFVGGAFTPSLAWSITENVVHDPGRNVNFAFLHMGGTIARIGRDATAFANRAGTHDMLFLCSPKDNAGAERHLAYGESFWAHLGPHTSGFYVNDMAGGATAEAVAANYGVNFPRLAALKGRYDPDNFFRLNANIRTELA